MAENLMQLFWDLSSQDGEETVLSANKMIKKLYDIQVYKINDDSTEI